MNRNVLWALLALLLGGCAPNPLKQPYWVGVADGMASANLRYKVLIFKPAGCHGPLSSALDNVYRLDCAAYSKGWVDGYTDWPHEPTWDVPDYAK